MKKKQLPLCRITVRCTSAIESSIDHVPFRAKDCKPSKTARRNLVARAARNAQHYDGDEMHKATCDVRSVGRATAKHKAFWRY